MLEDPWHTSRPLYQDTQEVCVRNPVTGRTFVVWYTRLIHTLAMATYQECCYLKKVHLPLPAQGLEAMYNLEDARAGALGRGLSESEW